MTIPFSVTIILWEQQNQAHAPGNEQYTSGYYTKCGIDSNVDVCDAPDGHKLIPITVSLVSDVKLCDFYYQEEPKF